MKNSTTIPFAPLPTAKKDHSPTPRYSRRFHAMAKPIGSTCNISCTYCFYLHKEKLLNQRRGQQMDDATLEEFILQYIAGQDGDKIVFSWQGGEPTMLGVKYFEKIVDLQAKYKPPHQRIENDLQTNGTLLDDEWCAFLQQYDFLVGLSIDGPQALHDACRMDRHGRPTFSSVMDSVKSLHKYGVNFNALTTVSRINAQKPLDVYRFLTQELGASYLQFNPCVNPTDYKTVAPQFWNESAIPFIGTSRARPGPKAVVTEWSVDPDDWGDFLCAAFDEWVETGLGRIQVNLFETAIAQTMGMPSQLCVTSEFCGKGLAVEHDGHVYSCDHYVYPEYCLGHLGDHPLAEMVFSIRQKAFGLAKRNSLPIYCKKCEYLRLCWGECPKNRLLRAPNGEYGVNYLCSGIKKFHKHATPVIRGIVAILQGE